MPAWSRIYMLIGVFILCASKTQATEPTKVRVLFVGNSYTFRNDLPEVFRVQVRSTLLFEPEVASVTDGGMRLFEHVARGDVQKTLKQGASDGKPWDVMVLQEQSVVTSLNAAAEGPQWRERFHEAAQTLSAAALAANPEVIVVLFQTWARHPDVWKVDKSFLPNGKDADEMMARVHESYALAAQRINKALPRQRPVALVSPVGDFWKLAMRQQSGLALYESDGSHPSYKGTWFTGLTLTGTVLGRSTIETSRWTGNLPKADSNWLKSLLLQNPETFGAATK